MEASENAKVFPSARRVMRKWPHVSHPENLHDFVPLIAPQIDEGVLQQVHEGTA